MSESSEFRFENSLKQYFLFLLSNAQTFEEDRFNSLLVKYVQLFFYANYILFVDNLI